MKQPIFFILIFFLINNAYSLTFTSVQDGNWNEVETWGYSEGAAGIDESPIDGIIDNPDGNTFIITNGNTIDFTGYDPGGIWTQNTIDITDGILYSSASFDNTNVKILLRNSSTIDVSGDFSVYYTYLISQDPLTTSFVNVSGEYYSFMYFSRNSVVTSTINASNINIPYYNYFWGGGVYEGNDLHTTINITDPAGKVTINNYYDSPDATLTVNGGDFTITNNKVDVYGSIAVEENFDITSTNYFNVYGKISATGSINAKNKAKVNVKSGGLHSANSNMTVESGGAVIYEDGGSNAGNILIESNGIVTFDDNSTNALSGNISVSGIAGTPGILTLGSMTNEGTITVQNTGLANDAQGGDIFSGEGIITVQSGGELSLRNNTGINTNVEIDAGGILTLANNTNIWSNANLQVDGNITASTFTFVDPPNGGTAGIISATGTVAVTNILANATGNGGTISANAINITNYNINPPTVELDMYFNGATTITNYYGGGYTYNNGGDLTLQNVALSALHTNITVPYNDIVVSGNFNTTGTASFETHTTDAYLNGNVSLNSSGTLNLLYADNSINLGNPAPAASSMSVAQGHVFVQGDVVQQSNYSITQSAGTSLYILDSYNSSGFSTTLNNLGAITQIEGNTYIENMSGNIAASGELVMLGNAYIGGTTFGSPAAGSLYSAGYMHLDGIVMDFSDPANVYLTPTTEANYTANTAYTGTSTPPTYYVRDINNNVAGDADFDTDSIVYFAENSGYFNPTIGSFSDYTLSPKSPVITPLPVELIHFKAHVKTNTVELLWQTASETNNDYFTVLKSTDGSHFHSIGTISGNGTSSIAHSYSFTDDDITYGTAYYRLKQTDYDGNYAFSKIISIAYTPEKLFAVHSYENNVYIKSYNSNNPAYTVTIVSHTGTVIHTIESTNEKIICHIKTPGIYFVLIKSNVGIQTYQITIW